MYNKYPIPGFFLFFNLQSKDLEDEEPESDSFESEVSRCSGLDPDYNPDYKITSSCSEELSPVKDASYKSLSSEEELEGPDRSLSEEDQTRANCTIKEQNKPITDGKRHKKHHKRIKANTDESAVTLKTCTKREDCKRAWDKKHYCLYCSQAHSKISRHLERKHIEVKDVAYAFSFPLRSKERKTLLEQLRNKGDFKHNTEVLEKGRGQIVTWKQPSDKASVKDYLPCPYCVGMFRKKDLWRHQCSCKTKKSCVKSETKSARGRVQSHGSQCS